MKVALSLALLVTAAATPQVEYFRYQRPIAAQGTAGQACVTLDAATFAHSEPGLVDLRLWSDGAQTPYAIHRAAPAAGAERTVEPLNRGQKHGQTVFDAAMPDGPYGDIELNIGAQNFIASVTVAGSQSETGGPETKVGNFTIFDLTRQRLGRSTVLHLPQADFRYLHFSIAGPIAPESVTSIVVGRLPAGKPKYMTVAEQTHARQQSRFTTIEFGVPRNVPVDRIVFVPGAEPANFTRDVTITVAAAAPAQSAPASTSEVQNASLGGVSGNLLRVDSVQEGRRIDEERLTIDAAEMQFDRDTKWTVRIDNGDDAPLSLASVRLEAIEQSLCFNAETGRVYTLYYGDAALGAPRYDYAALFSFDANAAQATEGPEQPNPAYRPRPDDRPFTERYPALLWIALIAVIVLLGAIALRSARRGPQTP